MQRKYGWKRDLPNKFRERFVRVRADFSRQGSLLQFAPNPVYDQGQEGSCTGNGTACAIQTRLTIQKYRWPFVPSRQMIYYNARLLEGTVASDAGATITDAVKGINQWGVCPEDSNPAWSQPYVAGDYAIPPTPLMYQDAKLHKAIKYESVDQTRDAICSAIALGLPVIIGIAVYASFESPEVATTGIVPMPKQYEEYLGGHCMCVIGYDLDKDWAIVRNSWGGGWGAKGNCYIPFDYLCDPDLAGDFWAIDVVGYAA